MRASTTPETATALPAPCAPRAAVDATRSAVHATAALTTTTVAVRASEATVCTATVEPTFSATAVAAAQSSWLD